MAKSPKLQSIAAQYQWNQQNGDLQTIGNTLEDILTPFTEQSFLAVIGF